MPMAAILGNNQYGKGRVRLSRVVRGAQQHDFREVVVDITLGGAFDVAFTQGDNRPVVATDSMKNTVYVLAEEKGIGTVEEFGELLARHFVAQYAQVETARITVAEVPYQRMVINGTPHPTAFCGGTGERTVATVSLARGADPVFGGGIEGLLVLRTAGSSFRDFVTDRYRTLPDTDDRIFATVVRAEWTWAARPASFAAARAAAREAMMAVFANEPSPSVQHTLLRMGQAALAAAPELEKIRLALPNKHHIPFNFTPFGLAGSNSTFVPTEEPYGLIEAEIVRG
jgi:urate oxidase